MDPQASARDWYGCALPALQVDGDNRLRTTLVTDLDNEGMVVS